MWHPTHMLVASLKRFTDCLESALVGMTLAKEHGLPVHPISFAMLRVEPTLLKLRDTQEAM